MASQVSDELVKLAEDAASLDNRMQALRTYLDSQSPEQLESQN